MGARGRNAPDVTFLDAARLMVAVLASVRVKDSAGIVRVFQKAIMQPRPSMAEAIEAMGLISKAHNIEGEFYDIRMFSDRAIDILPENHNFVEALASLIDAACRSGRIARLPWQGTGSASRCGSWIGPADPTWF
jgi:hypothetical protein